MDTAVAPGFTQGGSEDFYDPENQRYFRYLTKNLFTLGIHYHPT
jgi:hypothetical protein